MEERGEYSGGLASGLAMVISNGPVNPLQSRCPRSWSTRTGSATMSRVWPRGGGPRRCSTAWWPERATSRDRPSTEIPVPRRAANHAVASTGDQGATAAADSRWEYRPDPNAYDWCRLVQDPRASPLRRYERPLAERRLPGGPNDATAARASPPPLLCIWCITRRFPTAGRWRPAGTCPIPLGGPRATRTGTDVRLRAPELGESGG
jgi:hypothetical protein